MDLPWFEHWVPTGRLRGYVFREESAMRRATVLTLIGVFASILSVQGQTFFERLTKPNSIGGGIVSTHQDGLGGMSAVGPGLDLYAQFQFTPQWFMAFGTGFYTITDKTYSTENFKSTLFPNLEVRGGYSFNPGQKFMPFIQGGLHVFGSKSTVITPFGDFSSDTQYEAAAFAGAGADLYLSDKLAVRLGGDYRYVFTATVPDGTPKPKLWVAKAGIRYELNAPASAKSSDEMEYTFEQGELALDDLFKEDDGQQRSLTSTPEASESGSSLDDLFSEDGSGSTSSNKSSDEADALALLFSDDTSTDLTDTEPAGSTASSTPAYATTEISDLMNKVQNLKSEMLQKNQQIEDLQDQVKANEKALAELSGKIGGRYADSGSSDSGNDDAFKSNYENALKTFNTRRYGEAIQLFKTLLKNMPDNRLSSNCEYWIGESYNQMGDFENAVQAFKAVLKYRSSFKFDDALLMTGLCSLKLGDRNSAKENFQELVSRFPESEYTPKAMRYLGSL
jgi:tol-pal system protein YbgF